MTINLERIIFKMPGYKAMQVGDKSYFEIVKLCKYNDFVLVKHDVGYVEVVDGLKMFHKFGSPWWVMAKEYARHVQRCQDIINEGVLNRVNS